MPKINGERLLADLYRLREFGASGNGVVRRALSVEDVAARAWLADKFTEAGLEAEIDGVGNVFGLAPERANGRNRALLIGSHSDTQPEGGWLDGALGVIYGLEVARACREDPACAAFGVDVVSWMDEEHRFLGMLGSRAFTSKLEPGQIEQAHDADGVALTDALAKAGYADRAVRKLDPSRQIGYLEAHIEQGGVLEAAGEGVGIVSSIVGIRGGLVTFHGQQNHAGTTPMALRKDAAMAMVKFVSQLDASFRAIASDSSVWTFGTMQAFPGATSIVPGRAELSVQFRDVEPGVLEKFDELLQGQVAASNHGGIRAEITPRKAMLVPQMMDQGLQDHLAAAAEKNSPGAWRRMPSGAGHDAQMLADQIPTAMLFIPSIGGVSHSFDEDTSDADIVLGGQVMADAAAGILQAAD